MQKQCFIKNVLSVGGSGQVENKGSHLYFFDDGAFTYLNTVRMPTNFKSPIATP